MNLSKITDKNEYIKISAFDHRDSLKKDLAEKDIPHFKSLVSEYLSDYCTAILVDPEYGSDAIKIAQAKGLGILLSREKSGYLERNPERPLELYENFSAQKLKNMGADALKVLVYYNTASKSLAEKNDTLKFAKTEANDQGLPLLIEPITFPTTKSTEYNKAEAIVETAIMLQPYADVLKIEFPIEVPEYIESAEIYLQMIKDNIDIPWVILSRGMPFDQFKQALNIAKEYGASGFAVGRAIWQDSLKLKSMKDIEYFMKTTGASRMQELSSIF
jgi:tagatose 1,6-diphosphate aldolase